MTDAWVHTGYAQQIRFGVGALGQLPEVLRDVGARRVMLVTTAGRLASPDGEALQRAIGRLLCSTFAEVTSHLPAPVVQAGLLQARRDGVDAVVSFGGGSCADAGKAVNWFTEQERGRPAASWADRPELPHVAIPTTYAGAELTPFFGVTDPGTGRKQGAGGPTCAPIAAIYDPALTTSTPARVSAETGMNALAHCVEILWSPTATPEASAIAAAGARAVVDALPRVVDDPGDLGARTDMLGAAVLGGRCLQNGSMGVHHGLAQLVGGRTGIPHGLANAVILAHAVRYNAPAVPDAVRRVGEAVGDADDPAGAIEALVAALGLPTTLSAAGVSEDDLEVVARLAPSNGNVAANPRPVSEDDALDILRQAF
jgi:maleylacetate reductase